MPRVIAHQAKIRAAQAALDPRLPLASLDGCTVEPITVATARALIVTYEWLGTMPHSPQACYGLFASDRELLGAVVFGLQSPEAHNLCGSEFRSRTIALERGACTHVAPKNAASYLIRRACKQASAAHGWVVFFAYADPDAGECGGVYRASNWRYIGQGIGRHHGYREEWQRPGGTAWLSSRVLRRDGLKKREALAAGWHHRRHVEKHRYVWFEDRAAERHCRYAFLRYPKRARLSRAGARAQARALKTCPVCATPLTAKRSHRTTCSDRCRIKLWRDRRRKGPRLLGRPRKPVTVPAKRKSRVMSESRLARATGSSPQSRN